MTTLNTSLTMADGMTPCLRALNSTQTPFAPRVALIEASSRQRPVFESGVSGHEYPSVTWVRRASKHVHWAVIDLRHAKREFRKSKFSPLNHGSLLKSVDSTRHSFARLLLVKDAIRAYNVDRASADDSVLHYLPATVQGFTIVIRHSLTGSWCSTRLGA